MIIAIYSSQMSQQQHIAIQKQLRVMENRLDKVSVFYLGWYWYDLQALVRFNTALATNARLRDLIDHLRQEKLVFEGLQKKLLKVHTCTYYNYIIIINMPLLRS